MADDSREDPEEQLRELLRALFEGDGRIDPSQLAGVAGLPTDPAVLAQLMNRMQEAMRSGGEGVNWSLALEQAKGIANRGAVVTLPAERSQLEQAVHVASLWLDEATELGELATEPRLISRAEWVAETMPVWTELTAPVAEAIAGAISGLIEEQSPEELSGMMAGASRAMRNLGGTLFAMQLGQVVGQLSSEVVSGGDIGIPLLDDAQTVLISQNVAGFGAGLDTPADEVRLYLAVRELSHARLFRHARWLRLYVLTAISDFARGIVIDSDLIEDTLADVDVSNPEALREALSTGRMLPPKTDAQLAALARLETTLALVEGWVDVVTEAATSRLPHAAAIAETVRRRRATGGPAESAFAALVGLELRPRRLREAAAMWRSVGETLGTGERDALWSHPDIMPTSADIDDPQALIARLRAGAPEPDEIDRAIEDLLNDDRDDRPREG